MQFQNHPLTNQNNYNNFQHHKESSLIVSWNAPKFQHNKESSLIVSWNAPKFQHNKESSLIVSWNAPKLPSYFLGLNSWIKDNHSSWLLASNNLDKKDEWETGRAILLKRPIESLGAYLSIQFHHTEKWPLEKKTWEKFSKKTQKMGYDMKSKRGCIPFPVKISSWLLLVLCIYIYIYISVILHNLCCLWLSIYTRSVHENNLRSESCTILK